MKWLECKRRLMFQLERLYIVLVVAWEKGSWELLCPTSSKKKKKPSHTCSVYPRLKAIRLIPRSSPPNPFWIGRLKEACVQKRISRSHTPLPRPQTPPTKSGTIHTYINKLSCPPWYCRFAILPIELSWPETRFPRFCFYSRTIFPQPETSRRAATMNRLNRSSFISSTVTA